MTAFDFPILPEPSGLDVPMANAGRVDAERKGQRKFDAAEWTPAEEEPCWWARSVQLRVATVVSLPAHSPFQ